MYGKEHTPNDEVLYPWYYIFRDKYIAKFNDNYFVADIGYMTTKIGMCKEENDKLIFSSCHIEIVCEKIKLKIV